MKAINPENNLRQMRGDLRACVPHSPIPCLIDSDGSAFAVCCRVNRKQVAKDGSDLQNIQVPTQDQEKRC